MAGPTSIDRAPTLSSENIVERRVDRADRILLLDIHLLLVRSVACLATFRVFQAD
jgi:hypothetical protein